MAFLPYLVGLTTDLEQNPVVTNNGPNSSVLIINVGGLDLDGQTLAGPDSAVLTSGQGSRSPLLALLPAGAAVAMPGDIGNIYARAANTETTLSVWVGTRET